MDNKHIGTAKGQSYKDIIRTCVRSARTRIGVTSGYRRGTTRGLGEVGRKISVWHAGYRINYNWRSSRHAKSKLGFPRSGADWMDANFETCTIKAVSSATFCLKKIPTFSFMTNLSLASFVHIMAMTNMRYKCLRCRKKEEAMGKLCTFVLPSERF